MKTIILILSILIITSCTKFRYDVTYEKCNWQSGSVTYYSSDWRGPNPPYYSEEKLYIPEWVVSNVCDYSFTRKEEK